MGETSATARPRVVIVGAGFGGLMVARNIGRSEADITVIDRTNHHLFQPLLYQVATAGLSPANIAAPIRDILHAHPHVEVLMDEVVGVDTGSRRVLLPDRSVPYDYLVLATGSHYNYFGHAGWPAEAPSLKTLSDAVRIRERILRAFEDAERESDPERRRALMTFVLVGAGPTGVELAGAIAELAHMALSRDFRHINPKTARIIILEAAPRILGGFSNRLSSAAERELARLGVEVRTGAKVEAVDERGVVASGERIDAATVLWTAGVVASPAGRWLGADTDHIGRVKVQPDLSVPGHPDVFVIGDSAFFVQDGKPLPGVAPVAMQQGRYVAEEIRRRIAAKPARAPFHYHDKGNLATVGRAFAVLEIGRLQLSGLLAWLVWLGLHIWYLIGFRNKVAVMFQWAWAYLTWQRAARLITSVFSPRRPAPDSTDAEAGPPEPDRVRAA